MDMIKRLMRATATLLAWAFVLFLLAAALFAPRRAHADTIGLHMASVHVPHRDYQTGINPGLYWREDSGLLLGAYRNSLGRPSAYAAWSWERGWVGLAAGFVYGYERRETGCTMAFNAAGTLQRLCGETPGGDAKFSPLLAPSVRFPALLGITPRLTLIPPYHGTSTVLHLSIERGL